MIILKTLLAAISIAALAAVVHLFFVVARNPRALVRSTSSDVLSLWEKAYLVLVIIGVATIAFGGARLLLFWIPASWGGVDEDGNFQPLKDVLAGMFALAAVGFLPYLEKSAHRAVALEEVVAERDELERRLRAEQYAAKK